MSNLSDDRAAVIREATRRLDSRSASVAFTYILEVTGRNQRRSITILEPMAKVDFSELKAFSGNPFADT